MNANDLVKNWMRKVNLFTKRFLLVPINESLHWSLAIIINPYMYVRHQNADNESMVNVFKTIEDKFNLKGTPLDQYPDAPGIHIYIYIYIYIYMHIYIQVSSFSTP
jgi:hypothetical protein